MHISRSSLSDWKKDETSRTGIKIQINNLKKSIHSGAFYFGGMKDECTISEGRS